MLRLKNKEQIASSGQFAQSAASGDFDLGDAFLRKRHNYHMICLLEHFLYVQCVSDLFFGF